jgi:AcrR family transcriptional regulator
MTADQTAGARDDLRSDIVGAAAQLLREKGARAVTTRGVAEAAGVQAPTIYRLFGDKDGLVDAVAEHVMATYVAAKSAAADVGQDPLTDLRSAWQVHVEFGLANPELYTLLSTRRPGNPSPATVTGIEVLRRRVRRLAAAGLLRVPEERALMTIHAAGTGTVLALLGMPARQRDVGLSDAMFDAVTGSILATAPSTPDTTARSVAITFAALLPDLPALTDAERTLMAEWLARSLGQ